MTQLTAFVLSEAMAHSATSLDVKTFGAYEFAPESLPQDIEVYAAVAALRDTAVDTGDELDVRIEITRPDGSFDPDRDIYEVVAGWDGPGADRPLQPIAFPVALPVTLDQPGTWRVAVGLDDTAPTLAAVFHVAAP